MDELTEPRVRLREYVKRSTPHLWVLCTSFDTVRGLRGPYHRCNPDIICGGWIRCSDRRKRL